MFASECIVWFVFVVSVIICVLLSFEPAWNVHRLFCLHVKMNCVQYCVVLFNVQIFGGCGKNISTSPAGFL